MTGEYAVLDGAKCLALPTKKGQTLEVKNYNGTDLKWKSYDSDGQVWFQSDISLFDFSAVKTSDKELSDYLGKVLKNAVRLNGEFLDKWKAFKVDARLDFPLNWGLGSSSSLIHLIATWADISPLELYFKCENGSGYDVACAGASGPIEYWSTDEEISYAKADFNPSFKDQLFFVHLNKKQKSSEAIKTYLSSVKDKKNLVAAITEITEAVQEVTKVNDFAALLDRHEELIQKHTGFERIGPKLFPDFWGSIKSLGAWGGDFVLVVSEEEPDKTRQFFSKKGYPTFIPYKDLIL